jgi:cyanophycinase
MPPTVIERKVKRFKAEPLRPGDPRLKPKGRLLIIGGHEDKEGDKEILGELASMIGGGKLVVITVASESPDEMWDTYESVFRGLGIRHIHHLYAENRAEASSPRCMKTLEGATGVFFTGGDQLKITSLIGDTPLFSRMYEIFLEGGTIAGTSAGASIMSETMMVKGGGDESHRIGEGLQLAPGFGFAKDIVIDQHFAERGRIGRLLGVVGQNPRIIGIGIDENTAIVMRPHREFRVLGKGGVTVLDGRHVTYTNIAEAEAGCTMSVFGVTLHLLGSGDLFDLRLRQPRDLPESDPGASNGRSNGKSNGNGHRQSGKTKR